MKLSFLFITQLASLCLASCSIAQDTKWCPQSFQPNFDLARSAAVKCYKNENGSDVLGVVSFVQGEEQETYELQVPYVQHVPVIRQDPASGKAVQHRIGEVRTRLETRTRPKVSQRRVEVPIKDAKFWTIAGKSLTTAEAKTVLSKASRCILLRYDPGKGQPNYPFLAEMFDPTVLLVWFDNRVAKEIWKSKEAKVSRWKPGTLTPPIDYQRMATAQAIQNQEGVDVLKFASFGFGEKFREIKPHHFEVPLENAKVWTVGGRRRSSVETRKLLSEKKRVFITTKPQQGLGDKFFAEMFRDDVLVVWFDRPRIMALPVLAAYSFSDEGTKKENYSPNLVLENPSFDEEGFWSTGQCYSDYLDRFSDILKQDASSVVASVPGLNADAFTIAMQIKPKSFPGSPPDSGWAGDTGCILVGGQGGRRGQANLGGAGWLRVLTKPTGELSLVVRAENGSWKAVDLGLSLETDVWQNVVLGINASEKYADIRIGDSRRKVELSPEMDTAILASFIKFDPTFSFQYPVKGTAFHGHVKSFAILDGVPAVNEPLEFQEGFKWVQQPEEPKSSIKLVNAPHRIPLSDDEERFQKLLATSEQSPLVYEISQMLGELNMEVPPSYLSQYRFVFNGRDHMWQREREIENYVQFLEQQISKLNESGRPNDSQSLAPRRRLDAIASGIGYLFFLSKRRATELDTKLLPRLDLPTNFTVTYDNLLRKAIEELDKLEGKRTAPERSFDELVREYGAKAIDTNVINNRIEEIDKGILKLTNNDVLQSFASVDSALGFGWRTFKTGHFDKASIPNKRSYPTSHYIERIDKDLPTLIGVIKANQLDAKSQNVLLSCVAGQLKNRLDMESYIRAARSKTGLELIKSEQRFLDLCKQKSHSHVSFSREAAFLKGILERNVENFVRYHDDHFVRMFGSRDLASFLDWLDTELDRFDQKEGKLDAEQYDAALAVIASALTKQIIRNLRSRLDDKFDAPVALRYDQMLQKFIKRLDSSPQSELGIFTENPRVANSIELVSNRTPKNQIGDRGTLYLWHNLSKRPQVPAEGTECWSLKANANDWFGLGVFLGKTRDLSAYQNGSLNFRIKTISKVDLEIGILGPPGIEAWVPLGDEKAEFGFPRDGKWHLVSVPITRFNTADLTNIEQVFMLKGGKYPSSSELSVDDVVWIPSPTVNSHDEQDKMFQLEKELNMNVASDQFNFSLHNELRHLYLSAGDINKSLQQVEIILKNDPLNDYMRRVVVSGEGDARKAAYLEMAGKESQLPNLKATCLYWASAMEVSLAEKNRLLKEATRVPGAEQRLVRKIENEIVGKFAFGQEWPAKIECPRSLEDAPGPWTDGDDESVWPNSKSRANSDLWLARNHDSIRQMRPRVLLLNFSNEHDKVHLSTLTSKLIRALAESSRYHGIDHPDAKPFLNYEIFKFIDLREKDNKEGDSKLAPVKDPDAKEGFNFAYSDLFTETFAKHFAVPDPRDKSRMMTLGDMLDAGYVHEVWFFTSGNTSAGPHLGAYEVVEQKPQYDQNFDRVADKWVQAGNGGDNEQPWVGRSCRIGNINASRGVGCFLESLAHGVEGNSNSGAIPYFTKYFREYADFNLKQRYGTPFDSLYAVKYNRQSIEYPDSTTAIVSHGDQKHRVDNYVPVGGSAHFPPNARSHYDMDNMQPVYCTMADWRIGSNNGSDQKQLYTADVIKRYRSIAPDCMGAWLIYWRQNMPGLDNRQVDDLGKPMKNWWPFLFY